MVYVYRERLLAFSISKLDKQFIVTRHGWITKLGAYFVLTGFKEPVSLILRAKERVLL